MNNSTSFYTYLVYLIIGVALLVFIPERYRTLLIGILILAGMASIGRNWPDLIQQLKGQSASPTLQPMPMPTVPINGSGTVIMN